MKRIQKEIIATNEGGNDELEFLKKTTTRDTSKSLTQEDEETICPWYQQKTLQEKRAAQMSDRVLSKLYSLKSNRTKRPDWSDVAIESIDLKKYWSQWDRIVLKEDVLYRKWININTEESILQLLLPEVWKNDVMTMLHNDLQSGHLGIHRTVARAQNRFYWVGYKQDITRWIQSCTVCSSRKQPPRKAKSKMKQYNVGAPMERVALDIIGPLPLSYKGNKYALIVTDYCTKWAEGYPMANSETKTIVENFINNFICRFGVPHQIHSDQGRQFESGLFKELCARFLIDKTRTTAFRPQSDGLVERLIRSLEDILSKYINKNQRDWDEQLPWALMAYRSSEHETTRFSPCMLMLGREVTLPVDLLYGQYPQSEEFKDENLAFNKYVEDLQKRMWKIHDKARANIIKASEKQKRSYDVNANQNSYKIGDVVWLFTNTRTKNKTPKLQRNWEGPYFVIEVISDIIYKIKKTENSKPKVVHHDRLKIFHGEVRNWVKETQKSSSDCQH